MAQSSVPSSNTNFNGNFAFLLTGSGTSGPITRIGRVTADGNGGLGNIAADTNDAGTVAKVPHGSLSATTYAIDTNFPGTGRGTLTFTDSSLGKFQFVFYLSSSSGGVIQDISKNNVADGSVQLQIGAPFSNSSLAGDYGINFSGVSSNSSTAVTAEEDYVGHIILSSASSSNVTGAVDFSEFSSNQGVFTNIVVSGNGLTVGGDGTTSTGTRNALSLKLNTAPTSTLNFVPYIVNSQTMFVAGTDSNRIARKLRNHDPIHHRLNLLRPKRPHLHIPLHSRLANRRRARSQKMARRPHGPRYARQARHQEAGHGQRCGADRARFARAGAARALEKVGRFASPG